MPDALTLCRRDYRREALRRGECQESVLTSIVLLCSICSTLGLLQSPHSSIPVFRWTTRQPSTTRWSATRCSSTTRARRSCTRTTCGTSCSAATAAPGSCTGTTPPSWRGTSSTSPAARPGGCAAHCSLYPSQVHEFDAIVRHGRWYSHGRRLRRHHLGLVAASGNHKCSGWSTHLKGLVDVRLHHSCASAILASYLIDEPSFI